MQEQMSLFGDMPTQRTNQYGYQLEERPIARATDPEPSQIAAAQISSGLSSLQALFVSIVRKSGKPMTAHEVAELAIATSDGDQRSIFTRRETLRKRAGELVAMKRIRIAGQRRCEVTGKVASVYEVVE